MMMSKIKLNQLREQYSQMVRLRKNEKLVTGFTFNTIAGNIKFNDAKKAVLLLDHFIKELQQEIMYEEDNTAKR